MSKLSSFMIRIVVACTIILVFFATSINAVVFKFSHPTMTMRQAQASDNLVQKISNSKIFKFDIRSKKNNSGWWKRIIEDRYKPTNTFDDAIIQPQKYDYTNDPTKVNPITSPGYRNVSYNDFSTSDSALSGDALYDIGRKDTKTSNSNLIPSNSFSKNFNFDANASNSLDFSWYSPDATIVNKKFQPNLTPTLNSEYNGYFAGSRSFLYGLNFGLPTSLQYSMKTMSSNGVNASLSDLAYQYNFSLPSAISDDNQFTASGSKSGGTPTNTHYDQIKEPSKDVSKPNNDDFDYYQLWRTLFNHSTNTYNAINNPWPVDIKMDKGSSGDKKGADAGNYYSYSPLPFNTNPNPVKPTPPPHSKISINKPPDDTHKKMKLDNVNYNPRRLYGNFIGHPPTQVVLKGKILNYIQGNLLSYPFYIVDNNDHSVYLIHCYVFFDTKTSSTRIITIYSQFKWNQADKFSADKPHTLSLCQHGILNDLLFNDFLSAHDKDIKNLSDGYKFCEKMLPYYTQHEHASGTKPDKNQPEPNYKRPDFDQSWVTFIKQGSFSFVNDQQLKLIYADDSTVPKTNITEYPKVREKYIVDAKVKTLGTANNDHNNLYSDNDMLNYNQNIYKDNFGQAILQDNVKYTVLHCVKANDSYIYPPLTPISNVLYHFLLTNGVSEYFDTNNTDHPSMLNAYVPYDYYVAIVGCVTNSDFSKPIKNSSYPNPFFSRFLLSTPSVAPNAGGASSNSARMNINTQSIAEFKHQGKTIDDVDKLDKVYLGSGYGAVPSWIIVLSLLTAAIGFSFLVYYFYRRKQIKIWRQKKEMYQKIGPQTQRQIAVDDIIHMINDVELGAPKPNTDDQIKVTTELKKSESESESIIESEITSDNG